MDRYPTFEEKAVLGRSFFVKVNYGSISDANASLSAMDGVLISF